VKALVVYYSVSGTNRRAAEIIAGALGADLEEIKYPGNTAMLILRGWLGLGANIGEPARDPSKYGLVVVGGPIFAGKLAPPVKAYLQKERGAFAGKLAIFLVCGGAGDAEALAEMGKAAGKAPCASAVIKITDKERRFTAENEAQAKAFAESLKTPGA
jgi:flavodoxin